MDTLSVCLDECDVLGRFPALSPFLSFPCLPKMAFLGLSFFLSRGLSIGDSDEPRGLLRPFFLGLTEGESLRGLCIGLKTKMTTNMIDRNSTYLRRGLTSGDTSSSCAVERRGLGGGETFRSCGKSKVKTNEENNGDANAYI